MLFRPPVYPYTLSILYRLLPPEIHITVARIVSSIFYAGTAMSIFTLFRKYLGDLKAIGASILYILNPIALGMSTHPLVHSQFTFFYLISIYWLMKWSEEKIKKYMVLFGFFAGIAVLTRYTGLTIWGVAIAYAYLLFLAREIPSNLRMILKHLMLGALVTLLTLFPWMIAGHKYYSGLISPFTVASREVNMATPVPAMEYVTEIIHTLGVPATILIALGVIYSMFQRDKFHVLLLSWGGLGFMGILTIIHKEVRFVTFLTPLIAIISIEGLELLSKFLARIVPKIKIRPTGIKLIWVGVMLLLCASYYSNAVDYIDKYYYAGATEAIVFEEFKKEYNESGITLLVSPSFYPYGGLFLQDAEVYQMSSYYLNWLIHGIRGQPPDISQMIANGDFDYVIYCEAPYLERWITKIEHSQKYIIVNELFNGKCKILSRKQTQ